MGVNESDQEQEGRPGMDDWDQLVSAWIDRDPFKADSSPRFPGRRYPTVHLSSARGYVRTGVDEQPAWDELSPVPAWLMRARKLAVYGPARYADNINGGTPVPLEDWIRANITKLTNAERKRYGLPEARTHRPSAARNKQKKKAA